LYLEPWFIAVNAFPLALLGILFGFIKWQEKLSGDVAFARRLRASSTAKKYLKKAKKLIDLDNALDFYNALSRALLEYILHSDNRALILRRAAWKAYARRARGPWAGG